MKTIIKSIVVILVIVVAGSARGQNTVYNGLTTPVMSGGGQVVFPMSNNVVIGQEITMQNDMLVHSNHLVSFTFAYYSANTSWSGPVSADVQFYYNNGPLTNGYASPGGVFYDSGFWNLALPQDYSTNALAVTFGLSDIYSSLSLGGALTPMDANLNLPSDFTVVFTVTGLAGGDSLALPIYTPPIVGTNYNDYWVQNGSDWSVVTNNAGPVSFGMTFQTTPEPSVLGLGALGMVLMAQLIKRRK